MNNEDKRFSELKLSLTNSINKLEEKNFNAMIKKVRNVKKPLKQNGENVRTL